MKNLFNALRAMAVCIFAVTLVCCGDDGNDNEKRAELSAAPTELSFVSAGESKTVAVTASNVSWTATTTTAWLTLSGDTSGTEDGTLTVTADPNYSSEQLTGSITIEGNGVQPVTISVTQLGDDTPRSLVVSSRALTFTCGDYYTRTIGVKAENVVWEVTPGADWLRAEKRVDPESQVESLVVSVEKNTGAARQSILTLSGVGIEPVVIDVSQRAVFSSELVGQYVPALTEYNGQMMGDLYIVSQWKDGGMGPDLPVNIPMMGGGALPWFMIDAMVVPILGGYYSQGLDSFTFRDDGTFAATYHAVSGDFMDPTFDPAISEFPDAETLDVLPGGVLSYYTEGGKFYVSVDKNFLNEVGAASEIDNICAVIEVFLTSYPGLTLVSTPEYFALPFNYTLAGDVLTLSVDRDMMLPYKDLLKDVIPLLLGLDIIDAETLAGIGIDPSNPQPLVDFIETLFSASEKLEIGIRLAKK